MSSDMTLLLDNIRVRRFLIIGVKSHLGTRIEL